MTMANFPKGFQNGLSLQGLPVAMVFATSQAALGNTSKTGVYWVDSVNGLDGNDGSYQRPLATIGRAFALASAYDVIVLKPGHAETVANATAASTLWNKANISVVGLGVGASRPTFTFTTATTATITVSTAGVTVQNVLFVANFADVATYFTLSTAKDFQLLGCEFRDTDSTHNALTVVTTGATANAADGLTMKSCKILSSGTTAATTAIKLGATIDRMTIGGRDWADGNYFNYAALNNTATIVAAGANDMTNLELGSNVVYRQNTDTATGGLLITSTSTASSGMVFNNYGKHLDTAAALISSTGTKLGFTNNLLSGEADKSGFVLPAIADDA